MVATTLESISPISRQHCMAGKMTNPCRFLLIIDLKIRSTGHHRFRLHLHDNDSPCFDGYAGQPWR